jgi:diguanylate cyclase (GGDEF)-like protein/PAS domain S-box-containing protein
MGNQRTTRLHGIKNQRKMAFVLVAAILFFGALFTWWTAVRTDREMRSDLLVQARLVVKAVNIARIQALSGTTADLKSPDYQRLKEQLADVRSANPQCRSFYLIGHKGDGKIFFFVNSEPEGSENYFPPGQVYKDAPASYRRVFDAKTEAVEGPVTDHQGAWITALIPISDTATGSSDFITENDARVMVHEAVDFYRKNGQKSLLKELNNQQGKFRKGELYAFAYNLEMTMKAHPVKPELVGQNLLEKKDWTRGKYFHKEIQKVALSRGSGWVDYHYENPVNKKIMPKTTYVQRVDDLIVCAGAYKSTGEMLAVLGMDIDARAWKWNIAARSALPVGIILVLFIGAATIFAITRTVYHNGKAGGIDISTKPGLRRLLLPIAIPSLVALVVLIGGGWFYSEQKQSIRKEIEVQLTSILRSKMNQIAAWREKQIRDAVLLSKSSFFVRETTGLLAHPKAEGTKQLRDFLRLSQSDYDYKDIILVDPKGQVRLHLSESLERFHLEDKVALAAALRERKPVFIDLHISEEKTKVDLGVVVPLFAGNGYVKQPIGAVIMIIDASKFLYPLIQSWPVLSKTAETLLVRRDGDNVLFLNELRHQHGTALKLRIPLTKTDVPAVMAVLGRKSSMKKSKDYRGVDVVSVFQPVPDSPWFIVAKIDAAEVFANWQFRAGTILALIISLVIMAGALGFILWQRSEKALYGALRESEERTRTITDSAHDAITMMDNNGNISYWNPAAGQILGYTSAEAIGRNLHELIAPERFIPAHLAAFPEFQQTGKGNAIGKTLELAARRKDGREINVMLSLSAVKIKGAWHSIGILQDITERKSAEKKLARVSLQNELILKSAAEGILGVDLQGNHTFVNSAAARMLGYEAEELIGHPSHSTWHHTKADGSPYPQEECEILKTSIEGEVHRISTEIFWRKDGTSFPVEYASTPIYEQGRTTGVVLNFTDITERKKAEEQIKYLATHDLLTDLPSLRLANDRLSVALNMARRYKKAVAMMFIDLDGFKNVNDTLGHEAGDYVLQQVAKRLLSCVRETDTVARIGGDEFLIIATEINTSENAAQIAEKVIRLVSKPFIFKGHKTFIGASIGIALFPDHGKDIDQLIKKADETMYKVKNAGKNGFRFVDNTIK